MMLLCSHISLLKSLGAFWEWTRQAGNRQQAHALLTSGLHSNGYLDMSRLVCHPRVLKNICEDLLFEAKLPYTPDFFVGSAFGGVVIAYHLARLLGCRFSYTEREGSGDLVLKRFYLTPQDRVLVVDALNDVAKICETIQAVLATGATPYKLSGVLCMDADKISKVNPCDTQTEALGLRIFCLTQRQLATAAPALIDDPRKCVIRSTMMSPAIVQRLASQLITNLGQEVVQCTYVIGVGVDSAALSTEIGIQLGISAGFTEQKTVSGSRLEQRGLFVSNDSRVCLVEDVLTSGRSTRETVEGLDVTQPHVMPMVLSVADRTVDHCLHCAGGKSFPIKSLVKPSFRTWNVSECELCNLGSRAVRPKSPESWAEMNWRSD